MEENLFFVSPVYCEDKPEFLEKVDKACDKHIEASKTTTNYLDEMNKRTPLKRIGRVDEISGAIILLCSDKSSFITGQNIIIDGGYSIW